MTLPAGGLSGAGLRHPQVRCQAVSTASAASAASALSSAISAESSPAEFTSAAATDARKASLMGHPLCVLPLAGGYLALEAVPQEAFSPLQQGSSHNAAVQDTLGWRPGTPDRDPCSALHLVLDATHRGDTQGAPSTVHAREAANSDSQGTPPETPQAADAGATHGTGGSPVEPLGYPVPEADWDSRGAPEAPRDAGTGAVSCAAETADLCDDPASLVSPWRTCVCAIGQRGGSPHRVPSMSAELA